MYPLNQVQQRPIHSLIILFPNRVIQEASFIYIGMIFAKIQLKVSIKFDGEISYGLNF